MPVKYLMNVPKNNFVFSLHVLGYTFGAHGAHVALQKDKKAAVISSLQLKSDAGSKQKKVNIAKQL